MNKMVRSILDIGRTMVALSIYLVDKGADRLLRYALSKSSSKDTLDHIKLTLKGGPIELRIPSNNWEVETILRINEHTKFCIVGSTSTFTLDIMMFNSRDTSVTKIIAELNNELEVGTLSTRLVGDTLVKVSYISILPVKEVYGTNWTQYINKLYKDMACLRSIGGKGNEGDSDGGFNLDGLLGTALQALIDEANKNNQDTEG